MIYGRNVRQLFVVWGVSLALVAGLYKVELTIPALHDMILPLYWLILGFTAFMTLRWLRARSPIDRRGEPFTLQAFGSNIPPTCIRNLP